MSVYLPVPARPAAGVLPVRGPWADCARVVLWCATGARLLGPAGRGAPVSR